MPVRYDRERQRWAVEFEQNGIRVHRRLPKGCTRAQAETLEGKLRREIFDRETLDKTPDLTIGDAIDLWLHDNRRKNQRQAQSEAKQWEPWRGKLLKDAPEVAAEAVRGWTQIATVPAHCLKRSTLPRRASTVNRRLMMLKAVCKAMWRQKRIGENLSGRIQTLREPPHKDVYLSRAQVAALVRSSPCPQTQAAIWLLAYTGLRASELLAMPALRSRQATLTVEQSKTGRPRTIPLPAALPRSCLSALPLGLSYWELRKQFIAARKKAKLPPTVTLHTLRHTCASWLINEGVDLYTVGRILGHSSAQTTQRYAHLATDTLEKAMARLK